MKIGVGTQVWVVIDNENNVRGVWNSWYHAKQQAERLNLDIDSNIKVSQYLGGID